MEAAAMRVNTGFPGLARGVTLVELLVVVMVVALLAGISVPTYRQYSVRVKRTDAKTQLLATAQQLERCYTRNLTYVGCVVLPINVPLGASGTAITYQINATGAALTQNTFTLTATRQNGQTSDSTCGNFTLTERGVRGVSSGSVTDCW
jgi:type IV pilus assembly protein PilE